MLGYPHNLFVLPFDHRSSLIKMFFGEVKEISQSQRKIMEDYRMLIFDGFYEAYKKLKNKNELAILVDEEFSSSVLKKAKKKGVTTCLSTEKSGSNVFDFAYGKDFPNHIKKFDHPIVKALVRYNPANKKDNLTQLKRLKLLSDWCHQNDYKFMIEPLVPATKMDLKKLNGCQDLYDKNRRPALARKMISEMHIAGVEPDIWKIEAFEAKKDWEAIIAEARKGEERQEVAIICLGRGESFAKVKDWFSIAPREKLNGFAVGRTVFLRAVEEFHTRKINRKEAIHIIAKNYSELVKYWRK